jgi:Winged helix DNA-binding domain
VADIRVALTWDNVRAWRLSRHSLDRRVSRAKLLDVVRNVCGVHAQVQSAAELQVWARVNGVSPDDIRDALWSRRSLVRTWCMRGTLHLLVADDHPLFVSALRQHDRWWKGAWLRMIGMTEEELRSTLVAIRESLSARPVSREQLAEKVARKVGPKGKDRMLSGWAEMLKPAAFQGSLISGPPKGQTVTFVRPDRWLGEWKEPPPDEAWREILGRYLRAYGPASRDEFARWWGMQPAPAGRILKASADALAEVSVDGHQGWALAEEVSRMSGASLNRSARLLPAFDVYMAGTRPRESIVDKSFEDRVFRKAGWISPVVLIDGLAAGVWAHDRMGSRIEVTVTPFGKLSRAHMRQVRDEADRLGSFLGAPAAVSFEATAR